MDFERLDGIAQKLMKRRRAHNDRETGSVYYHGARTARGVIALRKMVTDDASHDALLTCAAMFHDVGKGLNPHGRYGALITTEALNEELEQDALSEVARLIELHEDKRGVESPHDIWARLLQDADLLDHIGSYEIWMACNYYAYRQEPMEHMAEWYCGPFETEMAKLRPLINYDASRAIFDSKVAFEREFIRRYAIERTGEYVMDFVRI